MRQAAIDCGTNAIRMLVAEVDPATGTCEEICRVMRIVRLGEGVDQTRQFSSAALARTFLACKLYAQALEELGDPPLVFAATSASRDVSNRERFATGVHEILGVAPEVISGEREAMLSFLGATWDLPPDARDPVLVFDIGGGSTEIIRGASDRRDVASALSVDLGCVRMTERHRDRTARSGVSDTLAAEVATLLDRAGRQVPLTGAGTVVGLSGTVTTVAAVALGLDSYDPALVHHARIPAATVTRVVAELAAMSPPERVDVPAMHPGRTDVIVAGGIILDQLLAATGAPDMLVSEADILDGLVLEAARAALGAG